MPSRNLVKEFAPDQYYHVYNRGVEKRDIFMDEQDYTVFLGLFKKYLLGETAQSNKNRHKFAKLNDEVEVLSYCLMPNHFHLLLREVSGEGVTKLMRRLATGYVMYFNDRYDRVGPLFQGTYKASLINKDDYLHHISRYIHLNPQNYRAWPYSSFQVFKGLKTVGWLNKTPVLELFDNDPESYVAFVEDYAESKQELSVLKWQLANNIE